MPKADQRLPDGLEVPLPEGDPGPLKTTRARVRTYSAIDRDVHMLEAIADYHGFTRSAMITSLVRREFWRVFPSGTALIRPDKGARVSGERGTSSGRGDFSRVGEVPEQGPEKAEPGARDVETSRSSTASTRSTSPAPVVAGTDDQ